MGKRQKQWARNKRWQLLFELGGECVECGTDKKLTFDCIYPQGDRHHRFDTSQRMSFYTQQHKNGNLQILCHKCNSRKNTRDLDLVPF